MAPFRNSTTCFHAVALVAVLCMSCLNSVEGLKVFWSNEGIERSNKRIEILEKQVRELTSYMVTQDDQVKRLQGEVTGFKQKDLLRRFKIERSIVENVVTPLLKGTSKQTSPANEALEEKCDVVTSASSTESNSVAIKKLYESMIASYTANFIDLPKFLRRLPQTPYCPIRSELASVLAQIKIEAARVHYHENFVNPGFSDAYNYFLSPAVKDYINFHFDKQAVDGLREVKNFANLESSV